MKRAIFLAVSALFLLALVGVAHPQELVWTTWDVADGGNGHEYTVLMERAPWTVQAQRAEELGGYLVSITNAAEAAFVKSLLPGIEHEPEKDDYYCIGLRQDEEGPEPAGGWYWLSGEPLDYTNWYPAEPNDWQGEDFGYLVRLTITGKWNDGKDGSPLTIRRAIVEREGPPPPPEDEDAPECSLNAPEPAELAWSDELTSVAISGFAADAGSGIASASLNIADEYGELDDEQDLTGLLAEDGSFELTVDLASIVQAGDADGRLYEITLNAEDNAGNAADPVSVFVVAQPDSTPPTAALDAPDPAELTWSDALTAVTISGFAADAGSGIANAALRLADEYGELDDELDLTGLLAEDGSFAVVANLASIVRPEDTDGRLYEITLNAEDNAGNAAAPISAFVLAPPDGTPPTVTLDSPEPAILSSLKPNELKTVTIGGSAFDGETGLASVMLTVSDEYGEFDAVRDITLDLDADGQFSVTLQLSSDVNGQDMDGRSYEVSVVATDLAGNVSDPCSVTIAALRPAASNPGNGNGNGNGHSNRPPGPPGRNR